MGMNTPGIIKHNFWQQVHRDLNASYVCIDQGQTYASHEIEKRSLCIDTGIGKVLTGSKNS